MALYLRVGERHARPIPFGQFPLLPREVPRILEIADVTGSTKDWVGRIPFLD